MVRASSQIEQELSLLQRRTQELEESLEPLYEGYLKALSEACGRQLVMATFHICTQAYPGKFLSLSLHQRNQLQQDIQALSSGLYQQLLDQREKARKASRRPPRNNGLAFLQRLLEAKSSGAAIIATDGSHESLLEKLSALGLSDESDEQDEDWSDDVPTAEDDGLDGWAAADSASSRNWSEDKQAEPLTDDSMDSDRDRETRDFEQPLFEGVDIFETGFEVALERQEEEGQEEGQEEGRKTEYSEAEDLSGKDDAQRTGSSDFVGETRSGATGEESRSEASESRETDFELDVPPAEQRLVLSEEDDLLSALEGLARRSVEEEEAVEESLAPVHLMRQQMLLERAIRKVFEQLSEQANERLQKANIVPNFPKALIAAASGSREMGEPTHSVPNVFKVSVRVMHGEAMMESSDAPRSGKSNSRSHRQRKQSRESDRRRRDRRSSAPRLRSPRDLVELDALPELSMISMQLSEVEFSDHTVSAWRSRIRQEFESLKKLGSKYQKTQRALETARAEDAWRASWTARAEDADSGSSAR